MPYASDLKGAHAFGQSTAEPLTAVWSIGELRKAVWANRVNFPSPVPIFTGQFRPEIQWRLVELYFIRGWSARRLAERYGVTARRIQQSLQCWVGRALARGYLQEIPPAVMSLPAECARAVSAIPESPRIPPLPPATATLIAAPSVDLRQSAR